MMATQFALQQVALLTQCYVNSQKLTCVILHDLVLGYKITGPREAKDYLKLGPSCLKPD